MNPLFTCLILFAASLTAQDDLGVDFQRAPFDELLAEAKRHDKLLFIDAYTTWCGPCKLMDAQVFPDREVAAVFNARFLNAKFDMEQGEGPGLAKRYSVAAYPTYLFVDGDGSLVHKGIGFIPKPALLELADVAVSDASLGAMTERYDGGDRSPAFVSKYAHVLAANYEQAQADKVIAEYLAEQDNWLTREHMRLILSSPGEVGGERMNFLLAHAGEVADSTDDYVYATLERALVNDFHRKHQQRSLVEPAAIADYLTEQAGPSAPRLLGHYALTYYRRQRDMENYLPAAVAFYREYPSRDYSELNDIAWTFYEASDDPDQLQQAIEWAEASVALRAYYPNLDTLAWLYHKTGQLEKAKSTARRAIEYAKAESLDYSETEKILQ